MPTTANSSLIGEQRPANSVNEKSGASDGRDGLLGGPQNMMLP